MNSILRRVLPHFVALLVFGCVSAMFFSPQYSGKALRQGDMVQASGMGQDIKQHEDKYGEHPQWAGNMFSGMPAYLVDMNYDGRWVKDVSSYAYFMGEPAAFLWVAMASFYLMLLMFGVNPWLGIIGGLAYGLSSYFPIIIEAGHITKMMAMAWIPALVGSIYYAYRGRRWLGAVLAGIFAAVEISCSHPQITYYFLFVIVALVVNEFVRSYKEKTLRKFGVTTAVLGCAAVLSVGANLVQLYYVADHSDLTVRGRSELTHVDGTHTSGLDKDYATAWSYGKGETFNLFIPNLLGGSSGALFDEQGELAQNLAKAGYTDYFTQFRQYWGSQPGTSGPVYLGALMVFLFVFGMFVLPGKAKWWIVSVTGIAILLSWGHNLEWLSNFMLHYFPLYNKFRVPSMILVIVQWSVPLLGILALQKVWSRGISDECFMRSLKFSVGITAGFAILAALVLPSMMSFTAAHELELPNEILGAMQSERASLLRADAMRSLIFVVLGATVLFCMWKGWVKSWVAVVGLALLTTIDLYNVDRRYVKTEDFAPLRAAKAIPLTAADQQIKQDKSNYRVANFTVDPFTDATTSYHHRSVGGYHAAKLRRYQELIEAHLSKNNMAVYDMLNTKYFITKDGVIENPRAAGNAWFVPRVEMVPSADAELAALGDSTFVSTEVAVIDSRFASQLEGLDLQADSMATIELTSYKVNELTYRYRAAASGLVIFSEVYFADGWDVYVDGERSDYLRADYVLRGMVVPAGEHVIEWRFAAPHFVVIVWITRLCSLVLLLGLLGLFVWEFTRGIRKIGASLSIKNWGRKEK